MSVPAASPWRLRLVAFVLTLILIVLVGRLFQLHLVDREFLKHQGDVRTLRIEPISAHRGMITDRHGEPLAISSPVATLWADPTKLPEDGLLLNALAEALGESPSSFFTLSLIHI